MKRIILALAICFCAHQLQASLGENEEQLVKRYGKVLGRFVSDTGKFSTLEFEEGDYHVSVTILDGQSGKEIFTRKDKKPIDAPEIQALLDANALGSKWEKLDGKQNLEAWVLSSKQAFAGYSMTLNSLAIKTSDMLTFELALIKLLQQQQSAATQPATAQPTATQPMDPSKRP